MRWLAYGMLSAHYRGLWECRDLPEWQRIGVRLSHTSLMHDFVYHHNAKAGSTSTHKILKMCLGRYAEHLPDSLRNTYEGLVGGPKYWQDVLPRVLSPSIFHFTFVRHPVGRAVSTFNNFFVEAQNEYTRRYRFARRCAGIRLYDASPANFDRYLDLVEASLADHPSTCDLHLRTQAQTLLLEHLDYSYIGRLESFSADLETILHRIGLRDFYEPPAGGVRENESTSGARYRWPTDAQLERIRRIYAEDFEAFGYELAPPQASARRSSQRAAAG